MMATIVEEMLANWNSAKSSILDIKANLVHLDEKLVNLDTSLASGKYSLDRCAILRRGLVQAEPNKNNDGFDGVGVAQPGVVSSATEAPPALKDMVDVAFEVSVVTMGTPSRSVPLASVASITEIEYLQ